MKKIINCSIAYKNIDFITEEGYVCAFFDDETVELLFIYDMSILCFQEKEFIGLTKDEALELYFERQNKNMLEA